MSVSVTMHEIGPPLPVAPNPLADLETVRKNANEKLRIRRLVQVREQSKELAAKVRQNYQHAKVKELAKIEQTRQEELKAWKRKHIRQLQDEYARCVGEVGEAHRAAEAAEGCAVWFEEKRATQQAVALQRGRKAESTVARERERKEALKEAKARKKPYVPSKSIAVQATMAEPKLDHIAESIPVTNDDNSTTEATLSPFEQFRVGRKSTGQTLPMVGHATALSESEDDFYCPGTRDKENIPGKGQDYSATTFTSPSDFRPAELPQRQQLQPFTQITELIQQRRQQQQQQQHHRPKDLTVEQQRVIQKTSAGLYGSYGGTQKTVQFDDVSENTLSFPTSSVLTNDDRPARGGNEIYPPVGDDSPRKVRPRKVVDRPIVSAANRNLQGGPSGKATATISKRGKAVLPTEVRETLPESSASASCGASSKVQYYDYNTRYSKEYDQPVAFVHREERRGSHPSAMEEANRYEKLQHELASARSKSDVDRTKPALEKQQTRKDYEKLSKELDNLTRSENKLKSLALPTKTIPTEAMIKQKAEARQRKANEAIETLLQQRALVTCPVVRQEKQNQRKARSVSRVNVAEIRSDEFAPPNAPSKNVSSDSCTSIVLGTFERPQIPLPGEDKGYEGAAAPDGAVDKIGKMKELLAQINEQRRLLTEEIAKEKTEPALPETAQELCAEMQKNSEHEKLERMKRRQEELLEQHKLLQKREREVAELERQLQEKMTLLWKKKQQDGEGGARSVPKAASKRGQSSNVVTVPSKAVRVETEGQRGAIEVEVEQPSTSSNSSSETVTYGRSTERTGEVPVKIIITVNDKSTPSKKKHKKKVIKKKSPNAVPLEPAEAKTLQMNDKTEEKLARPVEKLQLEKEAARPKKVAAPAVEMDFSPGSSSTTSTVYRPLPPKIGSLKINSLLATTTPESSKPNQNEAPKEQRPEPKHQLLRNAIGRASQTTAKEANLNPQLLKYIVRLLGMSRQSIDQLGVSSTSVSTPNASVVDVSGNVGGFSGPQPSAVVQHDDEIDRMNRLRKFIDENYNFLQEIDETLRRSDQSTLGSDVLGVDSRRDSVDDADVSRVADVWMKTLRSRERNMKKQVEKQTPSELMPAPSKSKTKKKRTEKPDAVAPVSAAIAPQPTKQVSSAAPAPSAPPIVPSIESNFPSGQCTELSNSSRIVAKEASLKSILKSPKRDASSNVAKIITPQGHVEVINLSDREEQEILERYSQLTERCSQRITELSQMINQVREEKRRLIEDSLSSLDQQESTKYMDLPAAIGTGTRVHTQPPATVRESQDPVAALGDSPAGDRVVQLDDPVSEEIDNIFSSKQIGLSKDSGIAMSRPLTASDIRESPYEECSQGKEPLPFEPFLKDIHKPATSVVINVDGGPMKLIPPPASSGLRAVAGAGPRKAPPVAITRFSPQLDEVPAHELSTILEVETPAVAASSSKVTDMSALSAAGERSDTAKEMVLIEARNKLLLEPVSPNIGYDKFPNYDQYVREEEGGSSLVRMDLENTDSAANHTGFRVNLTDESQSGTLHYRTFPVPAPPFDITEDDSRTKIGVEQSNSQSNVSDASLPDVVTELRKLNITLKPFNQSLDNSNRSTPLSEAGPEEANEHADDGEQRRQAEGKSHGQRKVFGTKSIDQLSDLLLLDKVFRLRWASSMLKKNQEKQQQQLCDQQEHSSSSSLSLTEPKGRNNQNAMTDDNNDSLAHAGSGKPPNLTEFLTRELMIRTQSDLQSVSSSSGLSSSPGSHSALVRSLLSISNLEHTSNGGSSPAGGQHTHTTATDNRNNVHRTSTPVAGKSTASAGTSWRLVTETDTAGNRTENLFSSESRISSVHWSSSSGSSEKHALYAPDVRLERQSSGFNQEAK